MPTTLSDDSAIQEVEDERVANRAVTLVQADRDTLGEKTSGESKSDIPFNKKILSFVLCFFSVLSLCRPFLTSCFLGVGLFYTKESKMFVVKCRWDIILFWQRMCE